MLCQSQTWKWSSARQKFKMRSRSVRHRCPGAATSSRGGIKLLADDLVDPVAVARHLEAMRQAEQWMKVSY
jgi:hypothetical protein